MQVLMNATSCDVLTPAEMSTCSFIVLFSLNPLNRFLFMSACIPWTIDL